MGTNTTTTAAAVRVGDRTAVNRLGETVTVTVTSTSAVDGLVILAWQAEDGLTGSNSYYAESAIDVLGPEAVVSEARYWFDLMDGSDAAEARRSRTYPDGGEPCTLCGRKTNPKTAWWIHATVDGYLFDSSTEALRDAADHDDRTQGCWAVGSECAKRIPAQYKMRWAA